VLYNIVKIDDSIVVVLTYIPPSTAGIQRARALVHHRAVGNLFKVRYCICVLPIALIVSGE
jgi:hypothetical protein